MSTTQPTEKAEAHTAEQSAKHTPGPWEISRTSNGYLVVAKAWGIAAVDGPDDKQLEADARLIAAAPELLKACKFFMGALDDGDLVRDTAKDHDPSWALKAMKLVSNLAQASAAIAKAEKGAL